jgi:hypothetical protein
LANQVLGPHELAVLRAADCSQQFARPLVPSSPHRELPPVEEQMSLISDVGLASRSRVAPSGPRTKSANGEPSLASTQTARSGSRASPSAPTSTTRTAKAVLRQEEVGRHPAGRRTRAAPSRSVVEARGSRNIERVPEPRSHRCGRGAPSGQAHSQVTTLRLLDVASWMRFSEGEKALRCAPTSDSPKPTPHRGVAAMRVTAQSSRCIDHERRAGMAR